MFMEDDDSIVPRERSNPSIQDGPVNQGDRTEFPSRFRTVVTDGPFLASIRSTESQEGQDRDKEDATVHIAIFLSSRNSRDYNGGGIL